MRVSDSTVEKLLQQGGIVTEPQLAELKVEAERSHRALQTVVIDEKIINYYSRLL